MASMAIPVAVPRPRSRQYPISGRTHLFEVSFSKPIDNSRLHREVDPSRKRECYSLLLTGAFLFVAIFAVARQHLECVRANYQIEALKKEVATLEDLNKQLRLEQAALADPQRIDALARQQLGLAPPQPQQVVRVEMAAPVTSRTEDAEFARNFDVVSPTTSTVAREP
jgi:cell division protein FtsL